ISIAKKMASPRLDTGRIASSSRRLGGWFAVLLSWSGTAQSKRGVAAVDHKAVGRMVGRGLAHQIYRNAAEIARLAEPTHRDSRHYGADEFIVRHDARGHVALDPARQDSVRSDAVSRKIDGKRTAQRIDGGLGRGIVLVLRRAEQRGERGGRNQPAKGVARFRTLGHVARGRLEHMEHAVEVGREHLVPFVLAALDERLSPAAA